MSNSQSAVRPSEVDPVPADLETILDPAWLTAVLNNLDDGEQVVAVEQADSSATLAAKVRFTATIEAPDGTRRTHPYCVKGHFDGGSNTLLTEACFYRDLGPQLAVRSPRAYYSGVDEATGRGLIVMDDLVALGGHFLNAFEPYPVETCRDTLGQLALLHAGTWGDEHAEVPWLKPRLNMTAQIFPLDTLQELLDDGRADGFPPELRDPSVVVGAVNQLDQLPRTCVIHGDTQSGNAWIDSEGRAGWLDWQVAQRGHWSVDVAYHLSSCLDIETRRAHEADLLRHYLDVRTENGVPAPSWDEAWDSYTLAFGWGYLLWTITRISSREVVMIHMPRIAAAVMDHDTFGRLGLTS